MALLCLLLVPVALVISMPVVAICLRVSERIGAVDAGAGEGRERFSARRVPNTGGVGIFAGIAMPMLAGLIGVQVLDLGSILPAAAPHVPGIRTQAPLAISLLVCLTALHVLGVIDDRRALGPLVKLAVMFAAAGGIVGAGFWFDSPTRLLTMLDVHVGWAWASVVITIVWIVAVTNAMNFMDNMDGLAGGVSAIAASCFLASALVNGQWFVAAVLALVVGSCLGFLFFNFPPARIYMGDGGSLVLGFVMAFLTVRTTYYTGGTGSLAGGWYAVFMPLIVLAVPLYDFVSVSLIRISQGKSPFVGDTQHFSHRLVKRGLSPRAAVVVIYGITAGTGIAGISLGSLQPWQAILVGIQVLILMGVLAIFEWSAEAPK